MKPSNVSLRDRIRAMLAGLKMPGAGGRLSGPFHVIDKYEPGTAERRAAYHADITYGTNNEFGFDYGPVEAIVEA